MNRMRTMGPRLHSGVTRDAPRTAARASVPRSYRKPLLQFEHVTWKLSGQTGQRTVVSHDGHCNTRTVRPRPTISRLTHSASSPSRQPTGAPLIDSRQTDLQSSRLPEERVKCWAQLNNAQH